MTCWTQAQAIELCKLIESRAPAYGGHVALTGGLLYKEGPRKDADVLVYQNRGRDDSVDFDGLFKALEEFGIKLVKDYGWCKKLKWNELPFDMFDPDQEGTHASEQAA